MCVVADQAEATSLELKLSKTCSGSKGEARERCGEGIRMHLSGRPHKSRIPVSIEYSCIRCVRLSVPEDVWFCVGGCVSLGLSTQHPLYPAATRALQLAPART